MPPPIQLPEPNPTAPGLPTQLTTAICSRPMPVMRTIPPVSVGSANSLATTLMSETPRNGMANTAMMQAATKQDPKAVPRPYSLPSTVRPASAPDHGPSTIGMRSLRTPCSTVAKPTATNAAP